MKKKTKPKGWNNPWWFKGYKIGLKLGYDSGYNDAQEDLRKVLGIKESMGVLVVSRQKKKEPTLK